MTEVTPLGVPPSAAGPTTRVAGRSEPLAAIAAAASDGRSVLVSGGRGTGRTTVLTEAARRFAAGGGSVLATHVLAGDYAVPMAALQRLLAPVRDRVRQLPPPQRATLDSLFGTGGPGHGPVPSAAALTEAVAALARLLAAEGRWLWCVDDLDRCDPASAAAITSVADVAVVAATSAAPDVGWSVVTLGPLSRAASAEVLASLPGVAAHPAAHVVLAQAGGNPLALVELARTLPPPPELPATVTELPVPDRLRHALAPVVEQLSPAELEAAVLAGVAVETPAAALTGALDDLVAPDIWDRLTGAGVVRAGRLHRIVHPVVRAAVLDRAGIVVQRAARLALTAGLEETDPARAWHRARSGGTLGAAQTAALEQAGHRLAATGRLRLAAYALAMAAEHTPPSRTARERRGRAVHCARSAGEITWADQLAGTDATSATTIIDLVGRAWMRGDAQSRAELRTALSRGPEPLPDWAEAIVGDTDPDGRVARALRKDATTVQVAGLTRAQQFTFSGVMALARHETTPARRYLRQAVELAPGDDYQRPIAVTALAWAEFDAGELDRADEIAATALRPSVTGDAIAEEVQVGALTVRAAVALLQGRPDRRERLRDVLDGPVAAPVHEQRLTRARGQADAVAGEFHLAYRRLRRLYDDDGQPVHYRVSDLGLADLASVALALDRAGDVAAIVADAEARIRSLGAVRLLAVWQRARALLAGAHPDAETHYRLALDDPATAQWPVERAAASVDYARWLRRNRRPTASRALLTAARDAYAAARLPAWQAQAEGELAAAAAPARRNLDAQLTPQQEQVVRLAAQGLTNQQIATRLALSPRTVSTHLSRAFLVLGVTRRSQLRSVIEPTD